MVAGRGGPARCPAAYFSVAGGESRVGVGISREGGRMSGMASLNRKRGKDAKVG